MNDDVITFAEVLRRHGYATGYAGKWHLDGTGKPQWAPPRQFGFEDNRYMFNRGHWKQLEDTPEGPRVKARRGDQSTYSVEGADAESFTTDFLCDRTIDFIRTHRDQAFCYMVSLPDPHDPDTVRPPYDTMFKDQEYVAPRTFDKPDEGLPSWGAKQGGFQGMAAYYGMVKCIDDNVGKVLACLNENRLIDRTVIVFTADHGDLRGEHHRQNKGVPYEGSARIPLLVYCPGAIRPGTVVRAALSCVDFKPTILRLLGIESAGPDEGRDCSALLTGGEAPTGWTDIAFLRGTGLEPGWVAAVTRRYKLVCSTRDDPWLFDLHKDPDELTNCFTRPDYREAVRTLSLQLRAYGQASKDPRLLNARIQADLQWAIAKLSHRQLKVEKKAMATPA
jgi:arylsulfatase A-like enzyme